MAKRSTASRRPSAATGRSTPSESGTHWRPSIRPTPPTILARLAVADRIPRADREAARRTNGSVFDLHYYGGFSQAEIAQMLGDAQEAGQPALAGRDRDGSPAGWMGSDGPFLTRSNDRSIGAERPMQEQDVAISQLPTLAKADAEAGSDDSSHRGPMRMTGSSSVLEALGGTLPSRRGDPAGVARHRRSRTVRRLCANVSLMVKKLYAFMKLSSIAKRTERPREAYPISGTHPGSRRSERASNELPEGSGPDSGSDLHRSISRDPGSSARRFRSRLPVRRRRPQPSRGHQGASTRSDLSSRGCRGVSDRGQDTRPARPTPASSRCMRSGDPRRVTASSSPNSSRGSTWRGGSGWVRSPAAKVANGWGTGGGSASSRRHSRHLVHRDVKPANILIARLGEGIPGRLALALKDEDFGKGSVLRRNSKLHEPRAGPWRGA